jgi:predicted double-glycine peptidase
MRETLPQNYPAPVISHDAMRNSFDVAMQIKGIN